MRPASCKLYVCASSLHCCAFPIRRGRLLTLPRTCLQNYLHAVKRSDQELISQRKAEKVRGVDIEYSTRHIRLLEHCTSMSHTSGRWSYGSYRQLIMPLLASGVTVVIHGLHSVTWCTSRPRDTQLVCTCTYTSIR